MRLIAAAGVALSLACISAAADPTNYQSYYGVPVQGDNVLMTHYDRAVGYCDREAVTKATPNVYNSALRACLYRYGFVDRGAYAYPTTLVFDHFLDR